MKEYMSYLKRILCGFILLMLIHNKSYSQNAFAMPLSEKKQNCNDLLKHYQIWNESTDETRFFNSRKIGSEHNDRLLKLKILLLNNPFNLDSTNKFCIYSSKSLLGCFFYGQNEYVLNVPWALVSKEIQIHLVIFTNDQAYIMNCGQQLAFIKPEDTCADIVFMPTNEYEQIYFKAR